jgi:ubiquinone/menaquinone biosynthesis C-methylase UbiE
MADFYSNITAHPAEVLERIAQLMELRAANPQQRVMLETYLAEVALPARARVLEVGCGTGAVTRILAQQAQVAEAIGIDPSPVCIARARELGAGIAGLTFQESDGRTLAFDDASFDAVVFHTTLCHIPGPEGVLAEAHRVLRSNGCLVIFDGDYATITVANSARDPLQVCIDGFKAAFLHDEWLMRRLPVCVREAGFTVVHCRSHGYMESAAPDYMLTMVDRGAEALVASGRIGRDLGVALKAEARRRVEAGAFFGFISYVSLIGRKAT